MSLNLKFISASEVSKLLTYSDLIPVIEKGLGCLADREDGGIVQLVRSVLPVQDHNGFLGLMPAYSRKDDAVATKLVTVYPDNVDAPAHQATILFFNPRNGCLKAIMDGDVITTMRTAAASAVATKYLANPKSKLLAILGSGHQARSHYDALACLYKFDEVRIWSRTSTNAKKLAESLGAVACTTVEEAVSNADIICTVTFASSPVLKGEWVKPGAHINAVGACRPNWRELDENVMNNSIIYVDSRDAAIEEAGDIIVNKVQDKIYAEIGEVVNGTKEARWSQTTVFKSLGVAVEDVVAAKLVYDKYEALTPPSSIT